MSASKVTQYGVDLYKIAVNPGGQIEFNLDGGLLRINGNLDVVGETTTIGSTDLIVEDNTITVNSGETGAGVTLGTAGLLIDRGILPNASVIFDESKSFLDSATGTIKSGSFSLETESGALLGLYTNSIKTIDNNDLYLLSEGTGVVSVTGTVDYEKQIWSYTGSNISFNPITPDRLSVPSDTDILINVQALKDYVRDYHLYNYQTKISSPSPEGDTEIEVFDTAAGDPASKAAIKIDNTTVVEIFSTQTNIEEVKIQDNTITSLSTNQDLIIQGNGTGSVQIPTPLNLTKDTDPVAPVDGVKLYSKTEADGGTGVFFINELGTNDELISRNKALLYSIIF